MITCRDNLREYVCKARLVMMDSSITTFAGRKMYDGSENSPKKTKRFCTGSEDANQKTRTIYGNPSHQSNSPQNHYEG